MMYKYGNNLYELTVSECLSMGWFELIDTERLTLNKVFSGYCEAIMDMRNVSMLKILFPVYLTKNDLSCITKTCSYILSWELKIITALL